MFFSTVPGMVVLGRSGTRARSRFRSAILADLAMRGLAISFVTLARIESLCSFLVFLGFLDFLCSMLPSSRRGKSRAAPFGTLTPGRWGRIPGRNGLARLLEYLPYVATQGRLGACSLDSLQN